MKIQGTPNSSNSVPARSTTARAGASERPATDGEAVHLSAASSELSSAGTVFDSARVQEIRQAISEGRFQINASAIADRLISTARELVDTQRKG